MQFFFFAKCIEVLPKGGERTSCKSVPEQFDSSLNTQYCPSNLESLTGSRWSYWYLQRSSESKRRSGRPRKKLAYRN